MSNNSIAAQISVYPLEQASLAPAIDEALRTLREHGLNVEMGTMSSMVTGEDSVLFAALQETFRRVAARGSAVMVVTISNACPVAGG
jgi:uncharacterized protein YqgV (UPF0045/DUF77 family)